MSKKYKIERSTRDAFLGGKHVEVKVTDHDTGESATSSRWDYEKKDIVKDAIEKLKK